MRYHVVPTAILAATLSATSMLTAALPGVELAATGAWHAFDQMKTPMGEREIIVSAFLGTDSHCVGFSVVPSGAPNGSPNGPTFPGRHASCSDEFPGRQGRVRVDDGAPLETTPTNAKEILRQMLVGKQIIIEYYAWPEDRPMYATYSLEGFARCWSAAVAAVSAPAAYEKH